MSSQCLSFSWLQLDIPDHLNPRPCLSSLPVSQWPWKSWRGSSVAGPMLTRQRDCSTAHTTAQAPWGQRPVWWPGMEDCSIHRGCWPPHVFPPPKACTHSHTSSPPSPLAVSPPFCPLPLHLACPPHPSNSHPICLANISVLRVPWFPWGLPHCHSTRRGEKMEARATHPTLETGWGKTGDSPGVHCHHA
jgi:hypothetical protein